MTPEKRQCQNCKIEFVIEPEDFAFYEKIKVPPPTWCPECRMVRRFTFWNDRRLFRRKEDASGKEIIAYIPPQSPLKVYEHDYWWSDKWDAVEYGRDYDFSRPFFEQFRELMHAVPWPAMSVHSMVNSEYCNNAGYLKNTYLCFETGETEDSAYVVQSTAMRNSLDIYSARHSELCYESSMLAESYRALFSINCENCTDVWFSKDLTGCSNCFGCVNLRNKSYYIFNKPHSPEEYQRFIAQFDSGSYTETEKIKRKTIEFWGKNPVRFATAIRAENSTGEYLEKSRNLKSCYTIVEGEDLAYSQFFVPTAIDSYDCTSWGIGFSRNYEVAKSGYGCFGLKFCLICWPECSDLEYCMECHSSSNLFGCVGFKKKSYCILNKQYTKEEYFSLRDKIIQEMNKMPYKDSQGRIYRYGEFFPPEFSPFAYNETITQDFFPLNKEESGKLGYLWRDPEKREYEISKKASGLPDHIKDVDDSILNETLGCVSCGRAYRIIPMELEFYRKISLPLPRLCPDCRFRERFKFVNIPKWWHRKCQCGGKSDNRGIYQNAVEHFHGSSHCPNEFETTYTSERPEVVYCEACYQSEVI